LFERYDGYWSFFLLHHETNPNCVVRKEVSMGKKSSIEKKSKKVSESKGNQQEVFKRLEIILVVIYGTLITLIVMTLTEKMVSVMTIGAFFSIKCIALLLMGIFMIEECCNVILVNSIESYRSTDRFAVDVLIACLYFIIFRSIDSDREFFIDLLTIIHFLNALWAFSLLKWESLMLRLSHYLKLSVWTNTVMFFGCLGIAVLSRVNQVVFCFEAILVSYLALYSLLLFLPSVIIKFIAISSGSSTDQDNQDNTSNDNKDSKENEETTEVNDNVAGTDDKEGIHGRLENSLSLETGAILTKLVVYAMMFVLHILNALWNAVKTFFDDLLRK
jgi:hypothetical protein